MGNGALVAVVQNVITDGNHGPYAVATSEQIKGSVTFSLDPTVWKEDRRPEAGEKVVLSNLVGKRAGWRAKQGRFFRPSDEQIERSKVEKEIHWAGPLTIDNIFELSNYISEFLYGKKYTIITVLEGFQNPCVNMGQYLEPNQNGQFMSVSKDDNLASLCFIDTSVMWQLTTRMHDNQADKPDPENNTPYFVIKNSLMYVRHRSAAGIKLLWIFALEGQSEFPYDCSLI